MCGTSAAFGVADGLVQGGMVGDLSFMSPKCIQVMCLLLHVYILFGIVLWDKKNKKKKKQAI